MSSKKIGFFVCMVLFVVFLSEVVAVDVDGGKVIENAETNVKKHGRGVNVDYIRSAKVTCSDYAKFLSQSRYAAFGISVDRLFAIGSGFYIGPVVGVFFSEGIRTNPHSPFLYGCKFFCPKYPIWCAV